MKKAIIIAMAALVAVSAFTACGKKSDTDRDSGYSRVLYDDDDVSSDEEGIDTDTLESKQESSDTHSDSDSSKSKSTDSDKNSDSSKKSSDSDKKTTSKSTSSKAATSSGTKSTVVIAPKSSSSKPASSVVITSSENSVSSDVHTDTMYDPDTDSEVDTDSEIIDSDTDTEDTDIELGTICESDMVYNGFSVGSTLDDVIGILGDPNSNIGSKYNFDECEVITEPGEDGETELVTKIIVANDCTITHDIKVGSTVADLHAAFGYPEYEFTYTIGNKALKFTVIDDEVTAIIFEYNE